MNKYTDELVKVKMDDIDLLFEWINDKECRKNAFNSEKIIYSEHKKWFLSKINDDKCMMYLYSCNNEYIGQVRIELADTTGLISYSIRKEYRGRGYGTKILGLLENKLRNSDNMKIRCLVGEVKIDNSSSRKVFEKLGYIAEKKDGYILYKKFFSADEF